MVQNKQPIGRFCDLGIDKHLLAILKQKGFELPTPIQHQVIPGALEGKDVIGIAQTGTGKTLAFAIPMIQRLLLNKGQGLVIVPTRELALQVEKAFRGVGISLGLRCVAIIGGASQYIQVRGLKQNPHIVVATPGRLADLMKQRVYSLNNVNTIVLDEADRMLDIGFLPQIKMILQQAPKQRQTMLFSATMPKSITMLASAFMKMPIRIEIAPQGTPPANVEHEVFVIRKFDKMRLLDSLLQQYKDNTTLIFSRTKHGAKNIARDILNMGYSVTEIHGNRSQAQRKAALGGFSNGRFRIMVATDIAARGIDVKDISLVINFDLPENSEGYVHRIGRTGRAGRHGKAISFVTPSQKADIWKVERLIRKSLPVLPLPVLPPEREKTSYKPEFTSQRGRSFAGGRRPYQSNRQRRPSRFGGQRPASRFGSSSSGGSRGGYKRFSR